MMKYLFAFSDIESCRWLKRELRRQGIISEIRTAHEFPDGTQGPEVWVREEDFPKAHEIYVSLAGER